MYYLHYLNLYYEQINHPLAVLMEFNNYFRNFNK